MLSWSYTRGRGGQGGGRLPRSCCQDRRGQDLNRAALTLWGSASGRLCIQLWELCVEAGLVPAMLTQVTGKGVTPGAWTSVGPGLGVGGDVPPQPGCEAPSAFFSLACPSP